MIPFKKATKAHFLFLFLILIASAAVIFPYFKDGFFPTHDGEWAVVRAGEMFRELRDLQIPPRFSGALNFGYGYPLFNFAYPMPYYIATVLHFAGFGFIDSIKIIFASSVPLSAVFIYFLSYELWKNKVAALASSILYIYLPYRMVDLYVRGSIGESIAFAIIPLLMLSLVKLSKTGGSLFFLVSAFCYASIILTHNIMAVYSSIVIGLFIVGQYILGTNKNIKGSIFSLLFGAGISSYFWVPALLEKGNILLSVVPIADRNIYYVLPQQLIKASWGYGIPPYENAFSYQIGLPHIVIFVSAVLISVISWRNKSKVIKEGLIFIFIPFLLVLCMFRFSSFVWELPLLSEINYPWTLLLPIGFSLSILAGFVAVQGKQFRFFVIIACLVAIFSVSKYAKPQSYFNKTDDYYLTNEATTTSSNELMPLWVKDIPRSRFNEKVETESGKAENLFYNSKEISFDFDSPQDSKARVNTIYYPGWSAYINGIKTPIDYKNSKGVMDIKVKEGNNRVLLNFTETPLRKIANFTSLAFLILLFSFVIFKPARRFIK